MPAARHLSAFPAGFKLSVVIPVYNETRWIRELVRRVQAVPIPKEIILVDDCSTDGTRDILRELEARRACSVYLPAGNQGKGAALREGFRHATGDVVIVQDADLEYDPAEYPRLIQPILEGRADVVFGSRFIGDSHRVLYFWHYVGNKLLTTLSNMFTNLNLTDMETCYKVFRREVLNGIDAQVEPLRLRAGNHRQDRQAAARPGASTKFRSATPAAPTRKARRSACATPSRRCTASFATGCSSSIPPRGVQPRRGGTMVAHGVSRGWNGTTTFQAPEGRHNTDPTLSCVAPPGLETFTSRLTHGLRQWATIVPPPQG